MINDFLPFLQFNRENWSSLRDGAYIPLTEAELERLKGINENISIDEVQHTYIPLSGLLQLHVSAYQDLRRKQNDYLEGPDKVPPYIIGIAGSVAVGKSTTARLLQTLLSRTSNRFRVSLVTTDGFLYPNSVLESKGIMNRKGFPESYDREKMIQFLSDVKDGKQTVKAPVYSHLVYDVLPDQHELVESPDILIFEGLNVLQTNKSDQVFINDFFDFSIYVDADEEHIKKWYIDRFLLLRDSAFKDPQSYFHKFIDMSEEEAVQRASQVWKEINELNLRLNILPTKGRADLILRKGPGHHMEKIYLKNM